MRATEEVSKLGGRRTNEFPNPMGNLNVEVRASRRDALGRAPLVQQSLRGVVGAAWVGGGRAETWRAGGWRGIW